MDECIFCKIINKKLPAKIIFENDEFLAFSPLDQISKGHTLLVSKKHFENIFDFETESLKRLMGIAQEIAKDITQKNDATGINLLHASGKDAQQSILHFHLHIVPRYKDDGLDLWLKNKL
jgi:histidine triad (HIT) family protein